MKAAVITAVLMAALLPFDTFANNVFSLIVQIDPRLTYPQVYHRNDAGVAPVADKKPLAIEEQAIEAFKLYNQGYNWGALNTIRKMRLFKIADNQYLALINRYEEDAYPVIREIDLYDNQVFFFIIFPKYSYGIFDQLSGGYTSLQEMTTQAKDNDEIKLCFKGHIRTEVKLSAEQINDFCNGKNCVEFEFLLTPPPLPENAVHDEGWINMILKLEKGIVDGLIIGGSSLSLHENSQILYNIFPLKLVLEDNFNYKKVPLRHNLWYLKEHEGKLYGGKVLANYSFDFDINGICEYHGAPWTGLGRTINDQLSEFACLMLKNDVLIWELDKKNDQYVLTRLNFEVDGVKVRYFDESKQ